MNGPAISKYKILRKLGEGSCGDVFLAKNKGLGRKVALKVLRRPQSEKRVLRFQREAHALAAIRHPNVVKIFAVEQEEDSDYIVMEYVEGRILSELMRPGGMDLDRFYDLAVALANALAAIHEKGIVHRDLKPGNIMVERQNRLKIIDFGTIKFNDLDSPLDKLTETGTLIGTIPYMSPEQLYALPVGPESDVFSAGLIFFEMLTNERAFGGNTWTSLCARLETGPKKLTEIREDVPEALETLIGRCLEKEPSSRPSARQLAAALWRLRDDHAAGNSELRRRWQALRSFCGPSSGHEVHATTSGS